MEVYQQDEGPVRPAPSLHRGSVTFESRDAVFGCSHRYETVHHTGDDGKRYCPTGWLMCVHCGGVAEDPTPSCHIWGEKPKEE